MGQRDSAKDEKNMIIKYVLIGFTRPVDKLLFSVLSTHAVILSEARNAKSKNLRTYQLHCTKQVRRSFDSLRSLRMTTGVQIPICLTVRLICVFLCFLWITSCFLLWLALECM